MNVLSVIIVLLGIYLGLKLIEIIRIVGKRQELERNMSFYESMGLVGLPIIPFYSNGQPLNFLLDTGSDISILHKDYISSPYLLEKLDYSQSVVGLGGSVEAARAYKLAFQYKTMEYTAEVLSSDLSHVIDYVRDTTKVEIHGLLGAKFFKDNNYVLDFEELKVYTKKN